MRRSARLLALTTLRATLGAVIGVGALVPVAATQAASAGAVAEPGHAAVQLAAPMTGRAAVDALRDEDAVAGAAAANGRTAAELVELLRTDDTAWLDSTGQLFYRDDARYPGRTAARLAGTRTSALPYLASDAFTLHSDPGSQRTLYMDFTGATVAGTRWNTELGRATLAATPYDTDGNPASFSTAERDLVQEAWLRVSEDYAPFDIDVTTEAPTAAQLERSSLTDQAFGMEAVITSSASIEDEVCGGPGATGVAYVGVFDEVGTRHHPAWICTHTYSDVLNVSESVSHEVGHTFGLDHDGDATDEYYAGQGGWAPIMGSGLQPIIQWSDGWYAGADNGQDDLAIISANAPYKADEAGSTVATAAALTGGTALIGKRTDVDVWSLGVCSGATTIAAEPAAYSPDLDIQLTLLDASGATIETVDPTSARVSMLVASGMDATLSRSLPAGAYYVAIDGVGRGTRTTGYDDYASIGTYTLDVTGCDGGPTVTPGPPSTPGAATVARGPRGGKRTISVQWSAPASTDPITGYQVRLYRVVLGTPLKVSTYSVEPSWSSGVSIKVGRGTWKVAVLARNAYGASALGPLSAGVKGR